MKKDGRKPKQIGGVRVDITPFKVTNETQLDVYKYIKPKVVRQYDEVRVDDYTICMKKVKKGSIKNRTNEE